MARSAEGARNGSVYPASHDEENTAGPVSSIPVLIVEDAPELAGLLVRGLGQAGFIADHAASLSTAQLALQGAHYAAIVLDTTLSDGDGLSLLQSLRAAGDPIPTLILSARSSVADRVMGIELGADDYLTKPFDFGELVARLKALLRRPPVYLDKTLRMGNVALDVERRQVFVDGALRTLSEREYALLDILVRRSGRVVTKAFAETKLFAPGEIRSNAVEVYVHRLRKNLVTAGATIEISTIRGIGYLIKDSVR